jgi:hypothetical protein
MRQIRVTMLAAGLVLSAAPSFAQEALRPAIGKPLASSRSYLQAHNYPKAMAQLRVADAVGGKTANETFVIEEMRAAIAQASGDTTLAARTYQDLLASGRVPPAEQLKLMQAEASIAFQQKNYAGVVSWTERYLKAGGTEPSMRGLLIDGYYLQNKFAEAGRLELANVQAEMRARQKPGEDQLQLLYRCQSETKDGAGALLTMSQLIYFYPKPDYWKNAIFTVQSKAGFSDRLTLDLDRLELAVGIPKTADETMEMIELALQIPLPGEAKSLTDQAYAAGVLGTGPEAPREQRLRDLVNKTYTETRPTLAKTEADAATDHDGNRLAILGAQYASYGDYPKGIALIQAALKKGGLRHPEDTKLSLAMAYLQAGNKPQAVATLKTVGGNEGAGDIARLWLLHLSRA